MDHITTTLIGQFVIKKRPFFDLGVLSIQQIFPDKIFYEMISLTYERERENLKEHEIITNFLLIKSH